MTPCFKHTQICKTFLVASIIELISYWLRRASISYEVVTVEIRSTRTTSISNIGSRSAWSIFILFPDTNGDVSVLLNCAINANEHAITSTLIDVYICRDLKY
jgi:hypothetical protein